MDQVIASLAKNIKCLILDVDGVLTDGRLFYTADSVYSLAFHVHDGVGIKTMMAAGLDVAIISSSTFPIIEKRAKDLGIEHVYLGQQNKLDALQKLMARTSLQASELCFIGDDIYDRDLIDFVGLGVAVGNALPIIKKTANYVTTQLGGNGAVREVCDMILTAQNKLEQSQARFLA